MKRKPSKRHAELRESWSIPYRRKSGIYCFWSTAIDR